VKRRKRRTPQQKLQDERRAAADRLELERLRLSPRKAPQGTQQKGTPDVGETG